MRGVAAHWVEGLKGGQVERVKGQTEGKRCIMEASLTMAERRGRSARLAAYPRLPTAN